MVDKSNKFVGLVRFKSATCAPLSSRTFWILLFRQRIVSEIVFYRRGNNQQAVASRFSKTFALNDIGSICVARRRRYRPGKIVRDAI